MINTTNGSAGSGMLPARWATKFFAERTYPKEAGSTGKSSFEALAKQKTSDIPWQILFRAINVAVPKYIGLDISGLTVIGRADPGSDAQPDLDLTPYEGQPHGVSRRHAVLMSTDDGLYLIDMNSANGTWVDGEYLQPGEKYRLRSGDMIEFGSLKLQVRMLRSTTRGLSIRSANQIRSKLPQG